MKPDKEQTVERINKLKRLQAEIKSELRKARIYYTDHFVDFKVGDLVKFKDFRGEEIKGYVRTANVDLSDFSVEYTYGKLSKDGTPSGNGRIYQSVKSVKKV